MKIGYWLGSATIYGGGVAPYAWRLLEILLNQSRFQDIKIVILCSPEAKQNCLELIDKYQAKAEVYLIPERFSFFNNVVKRFGSLISKALAKFNLSIPEVRHLDYWFRWFKSLDIDLLHIPYQTSPYYDLIYPLIVTMHDVQELHYPEFFTPQSRAWRAEYFWKSLEISNAVIVSFNHVKQDLIKYFQLPDNKVNVCPIPYDKIRLQPPTKEQELTYQEKYAKWKNFLLYPAQTWQHKNHLSLIKAVEYIQEKFGRQIHVICTGKKNSDFFPVIEDYLETSTVTDQIHFMDVVPESELCWLYKNCSLVVIPTLYEAGSFPLLEAMSLEIPVICSSVTSLPETIGNSHFTFAPLDINQTATLILDLLDNSELRNENIINSRNRIKELSGIDSVSYFINTYHKVLQASEI